MSRSGNQRVLGTQGYLIHIISKKNWAMELRQLSASWNSKLSQDTATRYGIESY
jgi:hypothetical protein